MTTEYDKRQGKLDNINSNIKTIFEYVHFSPSKNAVSSVNNLGYYPTDEYDKTPALPMTRLPGTYSKKDCEFNAALTVNNSVPNQTKSYYALVGDSKMAAANNFTCYVASTANNNDIETELNRKNLSAGKTIWEAFNKNNRVDSQSITEGNYAMINENGDFSIYNKSGAILKRLTVGKSNPDNNAMSMNVTVTLENDGCLYWEHPTLGKRKISKAFIDKNDVYENTNVVWQQEMATKGYKNRLESNKANNGYNMLSYKNKAIISENGMYRLEMGKDGNLRVKIYLKNPTKQTINNESVYYTQHKCNGNQDFYPYAVNIDNKMGKTFLAMNYPTDEGSLARYMQYVPPDHPSFVQSTNYLKLEKTWPMTNISGIKALPKNEIDKSCKKWCDDNVDCKSYNVVNIGKGDTANGLCLIRNETVNFQQDMSKVTKETNGLLSNSDLYVKKREPIFMENDVRKLVPSKETANYVSYNNYEIDMKPYSSGLGKYYDALLNKRDTLYFGKEGMSNRNAQQAIDGIASDNGYTYTPQVDVNNIAGNLDSQMNLKAAIQQKQIDPTQKNVNNYTAALNAVSSNQRKINYDISKITNSKGTGHRDVMMKNAVYDFSGNVFQYDKPILTRDDGVLEDIQIITEYENSIQILGAITSATLLVGAILLAME